MPLGMIGLGRMGANMVRRLLKNGQDCVVFDRSPNLVNHLVKEKASGATSLADLVTKLDGPRVIWLIGIIYRNANREQCSSHSVD